MAPSDNFGHSQRSTTISLEQQQRQEYDSSTSTTTNTTLNTTTATTRSTECHQKQQMNPMNCFLQALTRKKPLDGRTDTNLNRCLSLLDLTTLGVGSTLGLGLYVLAGQVASSKAGPAVVISFALAALASAFSAICYAEFAGRVPRAGSAYAYSYITVGEFVAFIIGWNMVLEYVIGASSVARGFSGYLRYVCQQLIDGFSHWMSGTRGCKPASTLMGANNSTLSSLLANSSANKCAYQEMIALPLVAVLNDSAATTVITTEASFMKQLLEPMGDYVATYFDWPSIVIVFVISAFILFGVKESTNVTLVFTVTNMIVVVTVVLSALPVLDLHNWQLTRSEVPSNFGVGGFLPYGWSGVLAGSATCFFGFIGFDTIASSAEEARNPKRNVPLAILLSLFISFVTYVSIAIVQTLLWPYYDQNKITILPYIFEQLDMPVTYWIVLVGALAGLASSQLGGMYPLPRILYSMGQDKLIYGYLAHVNKRLKLPVRATIVGAIFVAVLACLLDIEDLADMVSIGTLAAYSLVSLSVLIVRYENRSDAVDDSTFLTSPLSFTDILSVQQQQQHHIELASIQNETSNSFDTKPPNGSQTKTDNIGSQQLKSKFYPLEPISCCQTNGQKPRPKLLDLLIVWRRPDDTKNSQSNDTIAQVPDDVTSRQSKILIGSIIILTIILDVLVIQLTNILSPSDGPQNAIEVSVTNMQNDLQSQKQHLLAPTPLLLICCSCIALVALAATSLMLSHLPTSKPPSEDMFQVPFVPITPTLSIIVNIILMLNLSYLTWIRFIVWMSIGLFIYFTYGIWNSEGYLLHLNE